MAQKSMAPVGNILQTDKTLESNSTFSVEALNRAMTEIAMRSYWNLYGVQKDKVGLTRFDLPFNEFISETRFPGQSSTVYYPKQYVHYFNYRLIPVGRNEAYRRSSVYEKELDMRAISGHPELFDHNFLLFIDGELITTAEVYPLDDKIRVRIDVSNSSHTDGINPKTYEKYAAENPMVSLLFVPNYTIHSYTTTRANLEKLDYSLDMKTAPDIMTDLDKFETVFCFANMDTDVAVNTFIKNALSRDNEGVAHLPRIFDVNLATIKFWTIGFEVGCKSIADVSSNSNLFQLKQGEWAYPVPTENMIIFKKNGDRRYLDNEASFKKYYPDIYEVKSASTDSSQYEVFAFYDNLNTTEREKYRNDIEFYCHHVDTLARLKKGTLPELITSYNPQTFSYNEEDYDKSIWVPNVINYKVAKLRNFMEKNPWALEIYWNVLGSPNEKFYVDVSKMDLDERYRTSIKPESSDISGSYTLSSPCYVFAMGKDFVQGLDAAYRLWIDGLFVSEAKYHVIRGYSYYYFYIPVDLIKKDSLLEFEKYRLCDDIHQDGVVYNEEQYITYTPPEWSRCQARDVIVVNADTNQYLSKDDYYLEHKSEYLDEWVQIPADAAYCVAGKELRIHILDLSSMGKPIIYGVYQKAFTTTSQPFDPNGDNPTFIGNQLPHVKLEVANYGGYDKSSFRMFLNGRICVDGQYYFRDSKEYGHTITARTCTELQAGDVVSLDRVPGNYRVVAYKEMISEKGYVDLNGEIPLPLSFKWYDVYLNGIRLNRNTVDFVSATKMYIHGVDTRRNLLIMERNHDDDVFYLANYAFKSNETNHGVGVMDQLIKNAYGVKAELDRYYPEIIDTDRDYLAGGIYSEDVMLSIIIFAEYLTYTFFNPNDKATMSALSKIRAEYPDYYNGGVFHITGNINPKGNMILTINANETLKSALDRVENVMRKESDSFGRI